MKVLMVTGSYPPENCGVGDYTERIIWGLRNEGIDADILISKDFRISNFLKITNHSYDIIHIQYPTIGFGYKLFPQLYSLLSNSIVTLHEFVQANILRRLSMSLFTLKSRRIIFTNDHDMNLAKKYYPWIRNRSIVVPIGSNILPYKTNIDFKNREDRFVYFGLISPEKGIEKFLKLAEIFHKNGNRYSFLLMGGIIESNRAYADEIIKKARRIGVDVKVNQSIEAISEILANSKYGYLHFPDGVSERRGSFLAMLINGVCTFTTKSSLTPKKYDDAVFYVEHPSQVAEILDKKSEIPVVKARNAKEIAKGYNWGIIVKKHIKLYNDVLKGPLGKKFF